MIVTTTPTVEGMPIVVYRRLVVRQNWGRSSHG